MIAGVAIDQATDKPSYQLTIYDIAVTPANQLAT
jgi:hypothetical protein